MTAPRDGATPVEVVREGYDRIARRYLAWSGPGGVRRQQLDRLLGLLTPNSAILELGCGAGDPVTRELCAAGHQVTAVDVSSAQLDLAAENAPDAKLIRADMADLEFPDAAFDAVIAFYALGHVPRERHGELLGRIGRWLTPGGLFFATMGANDGPGAVEDDWLGAPMYFSQYDAPTNQQLVKAAGLEVVSAAVIDEDENGVAVPFLWVEARRPRA